MFVTSLISLTSCAHFSGNVVPEKGPTMEQVYDSMETREATPPIKPSINHTIITTHSSTFRKIPNPELTLYVFPHLAGKDEMPVPGYYTVLNAYTEDHYALPNEMIRE